MMTMMDSQLRIKYYSLFLSLNSPVLLCRRSRRHRLVEQHQQRSSYIYAKSRIQIIFLFECVGACVCASAAAWCIRRIRRRIKERERE